MDAEFSLSLLLQATIIASILSGIPLLISLSVGLTVSIFQAASQIQESTLSFVPKLLMTGLTLFFLGNWMFEMLVSFLGDLLRDIPLIS